MGCRVARTDMGVQIVVGSSDRYITMRVIECSFVWITENLHRIIVSHKMSDEVYALTHLISVLEVSEDPGGLLDAIRIFIGMVQELLSPSLGYAVVARCITHR